MALDGREEKGTFLPIAEATAKTETRVSFLRVDAHESRAILPSNPFCFI